MFGNSKKLMGLVSLLVISITLLSACAPAATPEIVEKEVVVEKPVVETVIVEKEVVVEKPVVETVIVEKEVVVEKPVEVVVTAAPSGEPKRGGVLVVGILYEFDAAMDPQKSTYYSIRAVCQQIYETLVRVDEKGGIAPLLAESWDQPDETTLVFHLREGVRFHDGSEMTAEDVKFTFDRLRAEETLSPYAALFKSIDEVVVLDPRTVTMKLKYPFAPLLTYLGQWGASILPKAYVESGADIGANPIGTGPFKFKSWEPLEVVLVRNDDYWDKGLPYLDGVRIIVNADENARAASLRSGAADFLVQAPASHYDIFREEGYKIVSGSSGSFRYLGFNNEVEPFDDWRVRQAIAWALDREPIMQVAQDGMGEPLDSGPIPPVHWASLPEPFFHQDYEKARQLLKDAGYPEGFKLPVDIGPWPPYARAIEVIKEQLAPLGIDVEINLVELAVFNTRRDTGGFTAYILGSSGQVDPDQFMDKLFGSTSPANKFNWADEHFDALVAQGVAALDRDERKQIYWEATRYLCEQSPVVFLYVPTNYEAMSQDVKGYDYRFFSEEFYTWYKIWLDR